VWLLIFATVLAVAYFRTWTKPRCWVDGTNVIYSDGSLYFETESPLHGNSRLIQITSAPAEWLDRRVQSSYWKKRLLAPSSDPAPPSSNSSK
jgi:hypothetical protein